jgi:hypothetical protein
MQKNHGHVGEAKSEFGENWASDEDQTYITNIFVYNFMYDHFFNVGVGRL